MESPRPALARQPRGDPAARPRGLPAGGAVGAADAGADGGRPGVDARDAQDGGSAAARARLAGRLARGGARADHGGGGVPVSGVLMGGSE